MMRTVSLGWTSATSFQPPSCAGGGTPLRDRIWNESPCTRNGQGRSARSRGDRGRRRVGLARVNRGEEPAVLGRQEPCARYREPPPTVPAVSCSSRRQEKGLVLVLIARSPPLGHTFRPWHLGLARVGPYSVWVGSLEESSRTARIAAGDPGFVPAVGDVGAWVPRPARGGVDIRPFYEEV